MVHESNESEGISNDEESSTEENKEINNDVSQFKLECGKKRTVMFHLIQMKKEGIQIK